MAQSNWLLAMPGRVSDHIVAITAATGLEPYKHHFVEMLGGVRHWPDTALLAMTLIIYLAGLLSAAFIRRRWLRRRRLFEIPPKLIPVLPSQRARQRKKMILLASVSAAAVVAIVVAGRMAASRTT